MNKQPLPSLLLWQTGAWHLLQVSQDWGDPGQVPWALMPAMALYWRWHSQVPAVLTPCTAQGFRGMSLGALGVWLEGTPQLFTQCGDREVT